MDLFEREVRHGVSRYGAANLQRSSGHKILAEGNEKPEFEWSGNLIETRVFRDADDFNRALRIRAAGEGFSDGILIRPIFFGHRGIDHRNWLRILSVGVGDLAPSQQRDTHGLEVMRRNCNPDGVRCGLVLFVWLSHDFEFIAEDGVAERSG